MQNSALFLDVDGVLNSDAFDIRSGWREWWERLDPAAVLHLNRVIHSTGCAIVISSAWRKRFEMSALIKLFQDYGFEHPSSVIGYTPDLSNSKYAVERGEEILAWLDANPTTKYAIVDDNSIVDSPLQGPGINDYETTDEYEAKREIMRSRLLPYFVWTDYRIGLTDKNADKLISLLW